MKNAQAQVLQGMLIGGGIMAGLAILFSVWTAVEYQSSGGEDLFSSVSWQAMKLFLWLVPFGGVGGWMMEFLRAYIQNHDSPICSVLHCALIGGLALLGLGFWRRLVWAWNTARIGAKYPRLWRSSLFGAWLACPLCSSD